MKKLSYLAAFILVAAVYLVVVLTVSAAARDRDLPPRPSTPTPAATHEQVSPAGALITLHAWNAPADAWTVVQWQDALGGWHDVDGWRGHLDDRGGTEKIWWVAAGDFDTGPFRWLVLDKPGGELLGTSDSFYLPSHSGEVIAVDILLP